MATSPTHTATSTTANKRTHDFDDPNPAQWRREDTPTPADQLKSWRTALPLLPEHSRAEVEGFLRFVAFGLEFAYDSEMEQEVYDQLIQAEAYDVFVDVFRAFNLIEWPNTPEARRPDPYKLVLQLPHDWQPEHPYRMIDAFKEVPVHKLVLSPQESDDAGYFLLPDAAHDCLQALLETEDSSLIQLVINGVMEFPDGVTDALRDSELRSIEFGWSGSAPPDARDVEQYQRLAEGLAECNTLKHVQIAHPAFFALHTAIDGFPVDGPQLESVGFEMDYAIEISDQPDRDRIEEFMWTLHDTPVTKFTAEASVANGQVLSEVFIDTLSHHKTLKQVDIQGNSMLPTDTWTLNALPLVASLSASCPTLESFAWIEGEQALEAGDNMRAFKRLDGDLQMEGASATLTHAMTAPSFRLRSLTFNGQPMAPGVLHTFFTLLRHNQTLTHLNLEGCHCDLRSVLVLLEVLKTNTTLKTVLLSNHCDDYYFEASDGNVYGFEQNLPASDDDSDMEESTDFKLSFTEGTTEAERALALREFAALQADANRLFAALDAHNQRSQREIAEAWAFRSLQQGAARDGSDFTTTTTTTTTTSTTTTTTMAAARHDTEPKS